MGTLLGHVVNGFGFLLIGLWHLFNHTKLYALEGKNYRSLPWFPTASHRHLELYLMMVASAASVFSELTFGFHSYTPFDTDGSIRSIYLGHFEHSSILILAFVYAASALALDCFPPTRRGVASANEKIVHLVAAVGFAQELLLFHLHSTDHVGIEGQYHWLIQLVIAASLTCTLLMSAWPESFVVSYARSLSLFFQGVWFVHIGIMLYTPSFTPKGCFLNLEQRHEGVHCDGTESLHRAKSLVNIAFSWILIGLAVFAVSFYWLIMRVYADDVEYHEVDQLGDLYNAETTRAVHCTP